MNRSSSTDVAPPSSSSLGMEPNLAGRYRPIAELGRGGMATVFLVVAQGPGGFNKLQVVKSLHANLAADAEFVAMFLEEARLVARLNHPNVVQTYDVGFDGKSYGIVMEYLEGQSLENIVRRGDKAEKAGNKDGRLPVTMHLRIVAEMLNGLHYAHDLTNFDGQPLHIVHRDVTPHNVIVTYDGHVKLVDFGIAKAADSSGQTQAGVIKGKVAYMAPEQFGGSSLDRRADIFAAGIILWQAVTGRRMWKGLSESEIFRKLAAQEIPTPRSVDPSVPEELERICMRALRFNRDERYQTAAEFQHDVEEYLSKIERVTPAQIGQWVGATFAESRERIKSVIEQQLKAGVPAALPSTPLLRPSAPDISGAASTSLPFLTAAPTSTPSQPDVAGFARSSTSGSTVVSSGPAQGAGLAWKIALAAVAMAGVGGLTVAVATRRAGAVDDSVNQTPDVDRSVTISVSVTPPDARILLDDVPVEGTTLKRVRDGATHRLRAEAPGYQTAGELISFDSTLVSIALTLEKLPTPAASAAPSGLASAKSATTYTWPPAAASSAPPAAAAVKPVAPASGKPLPAAPPAGPNEKPPATLDTKDDPWKK